MLALIINQLYVPTVNLTLVYFHAPKKKTQQKTKTKKLYVPKLLTGPTLFCEIIISL